MFWLLNSRSRPASIASLSSLPELCHERRVLRIECRLFVLLQIRVASSSTVSGHVSCSSTQTTDDVGIVHSLLGAFPSPVSLFSTVLTELVFVVSKRTVERGQFSKLISLVVVLSFRSRSSSLDDSVDQCHAVFDFCLIISHDETVEFVILVMRECVRSAFALLDAALSSNTNLCASLPLHALERVSTRADEETEKVDLGEFLDWDIYLVLRAIVTASSSDIGRRSKVGVRLHRTVDKSETLIF